MERIDCAVIGAGVIGLAVARALAQAGREVVVLEAEASIGNHTSSRNSEVIHAGIYYEPGSLKARLCVEGKHALYRYCEERGLAHRRCGKLIVATNAAQQAQLDRIRAQAERNGVADLQWLTGAEVLALEPELRVEAALLSPSTGIIDSHAYMLSLQGEAEASGAMLVFKSPVLKGTVVAEGLVVEVGGDSGMEVVAESVVNASGLGAQALSRRIEGLPADSIPPSHFAKGNYFTLNGRTPFRRLVYPVPEQAGLGVHLTLDMDGRARFGPDVEWLEDSAWAEGIDYRVDPRRGDAFYAAIRDYWPGLKQDALVPAYAGVRPKLQARGEAACDFVIQGPREHGVRGLMNLYGIESPGLTASLAIAERVRTLIDPGETT